MDERHGWRWVAAALAVAGGCTSVKSEIEEMPGSAARADARPPIPDAGPHVCFEHGVVADVAIDAVVVSSCAAWPSLDAMAGQATITRDGSNLEIDFEEGVVFAGTIEDDQVSLTYVHQHPWSDNCTWQATETLIGTVDSACEMTLNYDYVESVAVSDGSCDSPCNGSSVVEFTFTPIVE